MGNPFGRILADISNKLRNYPQISTWAAALFLSSLWTIAWTIVFFWSTWKFNLVTRPIDFICVFWMSIAAEALIRWAENTNFVASLSKPKEVKPQGDNQDFRLPRASIIFLGLVVAMYFLADVLLSSGFDKSELRFRGVGDNPSPGAIWRMLINWKVTALQSNVFTPLIAGTFARSIIYKRKP